SRPTTSRSTSLPTTATNSLNTSKPGTCSAEMKGDNFFIERVHTLPGAFFAKRPRLYQGAASSRADYSQFRCHPELLQAGERDLTTPVHHRCRKPDRPWANDLARPKAFTSVRILSTDQVSAVLLRVGRR